MSQRILHPEWRQYFETTKYPFADTATLSNEESDQNFIPDGTFFDAALYPIGGQSRLYLSTVSISGDVATLHIGDSRTTRLASGTINLLNPADDVALTDAYGRPAGVLVSNASKLLAFQGWTTGDHEFDISHTEFASRVCIPTPEIGVRGFELDDGSIVTGDVWFMGDDGVVLTYREETESVPGQIGEVQPVNVIRVDVVGDPLFRRRLCQAVFNVPIFLQSITARQGCREVFCRGDANGNVNITVASQDAPDTILRVRSTADGILIETVGERQERV